MKNPSQISLCCRHSETNRHHSCKTSECFLMFPVQGQPRPKAGFVWLDHKGLQKIDFRDSDWSAYDLFEHNIISKLLTSRLCSQLWDAAPSQ